MLQNITLGDIGTAVAFIVGLVGGIVVLIGYLKKSIEKVMAENTKKNVTPLVDEVKAKISTLDKKIDEVSITANRTAKQNSENFIKTFLSQLDEGRKPSQAEFECFFNNLTIFEHYDGNGFIHTWLDRLIAEGKFDSRQKKTLKQRKTKPANHA